MKIKNLLKTVFVILFVISITSCGDDDDPIIIPPIQNIAEIVSGNDNYSSLLAALQKAELDDELSGSGTFTVFAPNNAAFDEFLISLNLTLETVPADVLAQVLLNHVLGSTVTSAQLSTDYVKNLATESTSGENLSMYINTADGVLINGEVKVTQADVAASNGVIHFVDKVIPLPTVVTFATADATFSTLVAALTRNDQAGQNYVNTLSTAAGTTPAPFTVFAPTNAAFDALLTELGATSLDQVEGPTLTAALNLHVVAAANVRAEDLTDGPVETLGGDVTIDATAATITDSNMRVSNIVVTNVQASNGVVHVIDKVILPAL